MLGAIIVLTLISLIGIFVGNGVHADFATGIWPAIRLLPAIGLPIALVLAIALIIMMGTRRRRLAADDARDE